MTDNVDEFKYQISPLPKFEGIKIPVNEKAVRTFQDYNAAVIKTFEEYHTAGIKLCDVNIYDALSRVALHMFGCKEDTDESGGNSNASRNPTDAE